MKNLEEQNKKQFRQAGKIEGILNTLMSFVKDIFKNSTNPDKSTDTRGKFAVISTIPTSNKYEILAKGNDKVPNSPVMNLTAVNLAGQSEQNIMTLPCQPVKITCPLSQLPLSNQQIIQPSIVLSQFLLRVVLHTLNTLSPLLSKVTPTFLT